MEKNMKDNEKKINKKTTKVVKDDIKNVRKKDVNKDSKKVTNSDVKNNNSETKKLNLNKSIKDDTKVKNNKKKTVTKDLVKDTKISKSKKSLEKNNVVTIDFNKENIKKRSANKKKKDDKDNSVVKHNKLFYKIMDKLFYVVLGIVLCVIIFFVLCGGKNYFKLYYELREFIDVYDVVTEDYYGDLDKNDLVNNAIDSMLVNIGDVYTTYVDKDSTDAFLENVNGTYEGIGCLISTDLDGNIIVLEVFEDSPANDAGLQVNDIILKVNNEDYTGKSSLELSEDVKNSDAKEIVLNIKRNEELLDVTIKRKKIDIPVVNSEVIAYSDKMIGYIDIDVFSSVSDDQFKSHLKKLEKKGIDGLVVDVRDNNGGYLNAVTDVSSLFLKKGKTIYQLEDNDDASKVKDSTKEYRKYPIAVLVNSGSASASEIFASAIKDSYGGYVVGTSTYGKGTVQKTKLLSDGSMIKYTVQKWLTPKGEFINELGVTPTHVVEFDYNLDFDNQLDEALKIVTSDEK